jgi:hypothetical protein
MKRIVMLSGIAVIAAVAFTALFAELASAETTKILPEPTTGAPLTDTVTQTGEGHLLSANGLEVKCYKGSGSESWTSANTGTGEVKFKECKSALKTTCTGKGIATEGEIVAKDEVHFWLALQMETGGSQLIGALVFLIKPATEFTCVNKTKTIKNEVVIQENGCVAAKDLDVNSLVSTVHAEFAEWTSGETSILSVLPAGTTKEIWCLPTNRLNGGASELFAIAANLEVSEYKKGGSEITIDPMNQEAEMETPEPTKILPEPTAERPLTDTVTQSAEGHLLALNGLEIRCRSGSGAEKWTSANNGSWEVIFKECSWTLLAKCTSAGRLEGEIAAKGEVHFWLALEMQTGGAKLIGVLVFVIKPAVEIICWNKSKTIKYPVVVQEGSCIAAKDLDLNELISVNHEEIGEWTTGETSILSVLPARSMSESACLPRDTFDGGAAELFAIEANLEVSRYEKEREQITIELMN